jgi:hypothetical protein
MGNGIELFRQCRVRADQDLGKKLGGLLLDATSLRVLPPEGGDRR